MNYEGVYFYGGRYVAVKPGGLPKIKSDVIGIFRTEIEAANRYNLYLNENNDSRPRNILDPLRRIGRYYGVYPYYNDKRKDNWFKVIIIVNNVIFLTKGRKSEMSAAFFYNSVVKTRCLNLPLNDVEPEYIEIPEKLKGENNLKKMMLEEKITGLEVHTKKMKGMFEDLMSIEEFKLSDYFGVRAPLFVNKMSKEEEIKMKKIVRFYRTYLACERELNFLRKRQEKNMKLRAIKFTKKSVQDEPPPQNMSYCPGISFDEILNMWEVKIFKGDKIVYLNHFYDEGEAVLNYNQMINRFYFEPPIISDFNLNDFLH